MFRDRFRRAGGAPKAFDNIKALLDAAADELAPGYYEVVGEWVLVYWDGGSFRYTTKATTTHQQILTYYPTVADI